jgi:hypothetical protein
MLEAIRTTLVAVPDAFALGAAAMRFEPSAFVRVSGGADARTLALIVVYFAGVSQAIGHGVVLFLNRVPPGRFVLSLVLMGAIYVASALTVAVSALVAADLAFDRDLAFAPTIAVLALAHAPRLLGFLTLAPYLGEFIDRLLDVWILLLTLYGLHHGIGLPPAGAALLALLGWGTTRLMLLVLGRPLTRLADAIKRAAAGGPLTLTPQNIVAALKQQARDDAGPRDRDE